MTNQLGRGQVRYTTFATAIILTAVVISASIFVWYPRGGTTTTVISSTTLTSVSTTTSMVIITTTVTASSTSESVTNEPGPVTLYRTNGDWNFTVILNATAVTRGQVIAALLNLTNISGQNQTVHVTGPLYEPTVYSQNGTVVWRSVMSSVNLVTNWTYGPGKAQEWDIPTTSLHSGQTYILNVWPFIGTNTTKAMILGQYLIGQGLMINATIAVA